MIIGCGWVYFEIKFMVFRTSIRIMHATVKGNRQQLSLQLRYEIMTIR